MQVPAGVHVDLRTVNGGVRLDNVGGRGARHRPPTAASQGRVAGVSLLDARTTNGGVELELTGPLARDGRVSLDHRQRRGPPGACPRPPRPTSRARCTNGRRQRHRSRLRSRRRADAAPVEGTLNGGGARIDLQTTNGGVTIRRS